MPTSDSPAIVLCSNRLQVQIAAPGTAYHRTRFDWTGFITQVTLDGRYTFCAVEDPRPDQGSGGIGLCAEFGIDAPIGYDAVRPGGVFPKLGVGLLARPDANPYNFFFDHTVVKPFPIRVEQSGQQVCFTVEPVECSGYAAREIKTIRVVGNRLTIDYRLENVGQKTIITNEYCHNFTCIDGQPVGPGYRLRFPYPLALEPLGDDQREHVPALLDMRGAEIRWKMAPAKQFYCRPLGYAKTDAAQWELVHEPSGAGLREIDDFAPVRVALWGAAHVISPEVFVGVHAEPGESQAWSRVYEFFNT